LADENERRFLLQYLENRFGIPESAFDEYLLFKRQTRWSIMKKTSFHTAPQLKVSKVGTKAFQRVSSYVKPTTALIQIVGHAATRAVLEIDEGQLRSIMTDEDIIQELELDKGYVILKLRGDVILGLGFYADGRVRSQLPKKDLRMAMLADKR
jgi:NOL1/NOP2/fmu family ribosome biogenesis protein